MIVFSILAAFAPAILPASPKAIAAAARVSIAIAVVLILVPSAQRGYGQTAPSPIPVQPNIAALQAQGHVFKLGEACTQMTGRAGIIKRDACQRWYCSRPEYQDITERRPNFAAEMKCEWKLIGLHCLCRPAGTSPDAK